MRMKLINDYDSESLWLSPLWHESDWPLRFGIRILYCRYHSDELADNVGEYHCEIIVVSPDAVSDKTRQHAAESCSGIPWSEMSNEQQCECLIQYGTSAVIWKSGGNNKKKLLKEARHQLVIASGCMFGFMMDRPCNAIGSTGWDFIQGDILAGLRKQSKSLVKG